MKVYLLHKRQCLPVSRQQAWDFFSDPHNLAAVTPPDLRLVPFGPVPERMRPGMIVCYRVRPFPGIRATWVSEITHCMDGEFFVDEQRVGPYKLWHHQHLFHARADGTEVEDLVHYALPFGPLRLLSHPLLVRPRLERIFEYRRAALAARFGGER